MAGKYWTPEEETIVFEMHRAGHGPVLITEALMRAGYTQRTPDAIGSKIRHHQRAQQRQQKQASREEIRQAATNPPVDNAALHERIRQLEELVARMQGQKKWETHSEGQSITGGLLTLRRSDDHFGDENHLISSRTSLEEKFLTVLEQYQPERIQVIGGDDWIAGRGIFKEQDLSCAVSDPTLQLHVGAVMVRRFLQKVRSRSQAPIHWQWMRGNHDYLGKVSLAESQFLKARALCEDIPDVKFTLYWDRAHLNLADAGDHWVLVYHGFGHSKTSPNSPAFIDAVKDQLITMQHRVPAEKLPRRILSGHTHWLSASLERIIGLHWDTTGGLQRNARVQLGRNQRPSGWLVYVSPKGSDDIMDPIKLVPDEDVYLREISDPFLAGANRRECADALDEYQQVLQASGVIITSDAFGVTEGRW